MTSVKYEQQCGFRNKYSTAHVITEITEKIKVVFDKKLFAFTFGVFAFAFGVIIDLQRAFDTVNHTILLSRLEYYRIRGVPNNWFKPFLTERYQFTNIDKQCSSKTRSSYGIPQGSVLEPLFFLLYMNDLNIAIIDSTIHHFTDDTNLLIVDKSF